MFRKDLCDNVSDQKLGYVKLTYGSVSFRVEAAIWMEIKSEGFEISDFVEINSQFGKRSARVAEIVEMQWNRHKRRIEYVLQASETRLPNRFLRSDLRPAVRLGRHLSTRELALVQRIN
ncbi:MAG: hypothetical protein AAF939_20680 [Planctomycetota bacterium]